MMTLKRRKALLTLFLLAGALAARAQNQVTTTGGTAGKIPVFNGTSTIINSNLFYSAGHLGVGVTPTAALQVSGTSYFGGATTLLFTVPATASAGHSSNPLLFQASSYNSSSSTVANPFFEMRSEAANNNTANPGATLNLLYGVGTAAPAETGFYVNSSGVLHFASAQTFPITQGPQGPAGPTGPTGPAGPPGNPGPPGTLSLPYSGSGSSAGSSGNALFAVTNTFANGNGIIGTGGASPGNHSQDSNSIYGAGVAGYGGQGYNYFSTNTGSGGAGLVGVGGLSCGCLGPDEDSENHDTGGPGVVGIGGEYTGYDFLPGNGGEFYAGDEYGYGIAAYATSSSGNTAAYLYGDTMTTGNLDVGGNLSKSGGSFKIDDPVDPANKYLYHSFVESPDMMNIYNGNVVTDGRGEALVTMPSYFEALNSDFRYQLTVIGQFAQAIVGSEISNGVFTIRTDKPGVKVSWQVTGVRQDAWANAHRIPNEVEKSEKEKGHYLHPELFGHTGEPDLYTATHPNVAPRKADLLKQRHP